MDRKLYFPDPSTADETGLVAITPRLSTELLLEAYGRGLFPWSENPVRWYCPNPRAIFLRPTIRIPKKLGKTMRKERFEVTFDVAFGEVIRACATGHRDGGVWITSGFIRAYEELHRLGFAHSVEVWQDGKLVGGLYGVQMGAMFAGESMFHRVSNASKVAFAYLAAHLEHIGVVMMDAQVLNEHTARLGAILVRRHDFLLLLEQVLQLPAQFVGERWPRNPIATPTRPSSGS